MRRRRLLVFRRIVSSTCLICCLMTVRSVLLVRCVLLVRSVLAMKMAVTVLVVSSEPGMLCATAQQKRNHPKAAMDVVELMLPSVRQRKK